VNAGQEMEGELNENVKPMTQIGLFFGNFENKTVQVGAELTRIGVRNDHLYGKDMIKESVSVIGCKRYIFTKRIDWCGRRRMRWR
jgi:hypothetical protein